MKLVINKNDILHNYDLVAKTAGVPVFAVLKIDGYGLGITAMANLLYEHGAKHFAVSTLEEALKVKEAAPDATVLMLNPCIKFEEADTAIRAGITVTISSERSALLADDAAARANLTAQVHVKIDTGMGRFGFLFEEAESTARLLKSLTHVKIDGIYSHFSRCFDGRKNNKMTLAQDKRFTDTVAALEKEGITVGIKHIANSAGALMYDWARHDAVRVGSALTGKIAVKDHWKLRTAFHIEAEIDEIRALPKKFTVGYGAEAKMKHDGRIAVIPIGIADGLFLVRKPVKPHVRDVFRAAVNLLRPRVYANYGTLGKHKIRVLGRPGSNHIMLDVTKYPCNVGDTVIFDCNPLFIDSSVERVYIEK